MELFGIDANPVPDGAAVGEITASDGARLRFAYWRPQKRRVLGTVCVFHGRAETIEKYFEVVRDLRGRGFAVATLDWRGQGGSERRLSNSLKGHVDSFEEYDRDLDAFVQQVVLPDCPPPYFVLAHSFGALICLRSAHAGRSHFTRLVLTSPLAGLATRRPSQRTIHATAALLTALGLGEIEVPLSNTPSANNGAFEHNRLTSDPARFARTVELWRQLPQVAVRGATVGWVYAACKAMAEAGEPDFAPTIGVPVLAVAGLRDTIVSVPAVERLAGGLRAGAMTIIPGASHEILMERDTLREQFWAAFDAFVPGS